MKIKPVKTLTIRRKRWLHGEGSSGSRLYRNRDKKMCCLGFYCLKAGLTIGDLDDRTSPGNLSYEIRFPGLTRIQSGYAINTSACQSLMMVNDNSSIDEATRESTITKRFKKIGVLVRFVG